ncbi:hypothetical protein FOL47_007324 [Perkinsus chesapeaki]|uniref:Uncharacterized protein n=1 Tax=Perkinsus chesapeaki TaxID=330153 RepID=A0A7J6MW00_PERCH|nr:hypothetical protein FOL47_007324 [Perkinsus chesapeaki]
MHDAMHTRAHEMTGLLSKAQSELDATINPLNRAIKEALDLGQDFEGLDEATHYAANPWLKLFGGNQVRSLIEAHHGLAHIAQPSLARVHELTDKEGAKRRIIRILGVVGFLSFGVFLRWSPVMAESVPLRIGGVQRRGRFLIEEAEVDSEGVASQTYHTKVSYRECCGGDIPSRSGSLNCGDASVKSCASSSTTAECGYVSSSSSASTSVAIEPLRVRRVGRFLCDCFPEQAQVMPRKQKRRQFLSVGGIETRARQEQYGALGRPA